MPPEKERSRPVTSRTAGEDRTSGGRSLHCQYSYGLCVADHDDTTFAQAVAQASAATAGHWLSYYQRLIAEQPHHVHHLVHLRRLRTLAERIEASEWAS